MTLHDLLQTEGASIVDVRSTWEYAEGSARNSINIPLDEVPMRIAELKNLSKPLIMCCRSGARSGQAVAYLRQMGIPNVYNGGSWYEVEMQQLQA